MVKGKSIYPELNDRKWLHQEYWTKKRKCREIANTVGCDPTTVWLALKREGIRVRTRSEVQQGEQNHNFGKKLPVGQREKLSKAHRGFKHTVEAKRKIGKAQKGERHWNYGKELSEETKKKLSEALGGANNPNYGKQKSKETRQKISEALKGHTPWNKGKKGVFSEETRQKIREARIHQKDPRLGTHHSEVSKAKMREARKHRIFPKNHTKPELIFVGFCGKDNLPFKYTGDGSFWIGKDKDTINPDFTHLTKKIVVEVFSWFHDELRNRHVQPKSRYEDRKKIFKKYGYKMIVFWQDDLDREDAEARVLSVLQKEKII